MTLKQKKVRRSAIIRELANMSHNSWRNARPEDYLPLEAELNRLNAEIGAARQAQNAKKIVAMMKRACRQRPVM